MHARAPADPGEGSELPYYAVQPSGVHTRRGHGDRAALQVPCMPELQTFKENAEYEVILGKLQLDVERKKWVAGYPFNTLVEKLIDNYNQARGCMSRMEARLLKKGRLDEFNRQFQDNVDRGVFKPIPKKEADQYKGAVNYISMVEAFKTGPYATTPLRICMNSSMK